LGILRGRNPSHNAKASDEVDVHDIHPVKHEATNRERSSVAKSDRSLLEIAPPMDCLNVIGMIISPRSSHAFGLDVVGHNLVVIREVRVADRAFAVLLDDLSVQQLPHLSWRPQFAVSPGVVRIVDSLNAKLKSTFFPRLLATAAEE
jgi:hypothetical protein